MVRGVAAALLLLLQLAAQHVGAAPAPTLAQESVNGEAVHLANLAFIASKPVEFEVPLVKAMVAIQEMTEKPVVRFDSMTASRLQYSVLVGDRTRVAAAIASVKGIKLDRPGFAILPSVPGREVPEAPTKIAPAETASLPPQPQPEPQPETQPETPRAPDVVLHQSDDPRAPVFDDAKAGVRADVKPENAESFSNSFAGSFEDSRKEEIRDGVDRKLATPEGLRELHARNLHQLQRLNPAAQLVVASTLDVLQVAGTLIELHDAAINGFVVFYRVVKGAAGDIPRVAVSFGATATSRLIRAIAPVRDAALGTDGLLEPVGAAADDDVLTAGPDAGSRGSGVAERESSAFAVPAHGSQNAEGDSADMGPAAAQPLASRVIEAVAHDRLPQAESAEPNAEVSQTGGGEAAVKAALRSRWLAAMAARRAQQQSAEQSVGAAQTGPDSTAGVAASEALRARWLAAMAARRNEVPEESAGMAQRMHKSWLGESVTPGASGLLDSAPVSYKHGEAFYESVSPVDHAVRTQIQNSNRDRLSGLTGDAAVAIKNLLDLCAPRGVLLRLTDATEEGRLVGYEIVSGTPEVLAQVAKQAGVSIDGGHLSVPNSVVVTADVAEPASPELLEAYAMVDEEDRRVARSRLFLKRQRRVR